MLFRRKRKAGSQPDRRAEALETNLIAWGGELHPERLGPPYCVLGQNGAGKTLTIRMLMRTMLAPRGELLHRVLVYDPKLDSYPILRGMGVPPERIHVLNPFDLRSERWHISADIKTSAAAREFAATLLPPEKGEHPYFANTPRALVSEIIDVLRQKAGTSWTLNDLVQMVMNWKFEGVLEAGGPRAQAAIRGHIKKNAVDTAANLVSTMQTGIVRYETVAALWERSTREPFSIEQWMDERTPPSVLLLGTYPEASESLNHINRAIFQRCAQLLRMKAESPADQTWFVIDELRIAKELESLPELLLAARSKGGHFVLGCQDVHGLQDVYGKARTAELIAQCHNIALLRLSSPDSIEWASAYFGTDNWWVPTLGDSSGATNSTSRSYSVQERKNILGSRFRNLRLPSPGFGLEGIFATPFDKPWHGHLSPDFLNRFLAPIAQDAGVEKRPSDHQEPAPFTRGLAEKLGVGLAEGEELSPQPRQGFKPRFPSLRS